MGLPVLALSDFGVSEEMINTVFADSGCIGTLADLAAGRLVTADPAWTAANYFHPAADNTWLAADRRPAGRPRGRYPAGAASGQWLPLVASAPSAPAGGAADPCNSRGGAGSSRGGRASLEHQVAQLAYGPRTARPAQHQPRRLPDLRMGIGHRHRPAHQPHRTQVVDVVAEVGGAGRVDPLPLAASRGPPRPSPRCRAAPRRRASPPGPATTRLVSFDRIRIGTPALRSRSMPSPSDRLTRTDSMPSSLTTAVSSVCTPSKSVITTSTSSADPGVERGGQGAGQHQVVVVVDLDRAQLGHRDDLRAPEEAVPGLPEPGHRHHVEGAGLPVVRLPVLAAGPVGGVVVDSGGLAVGAGSPEELIRRHRREDRVGLAAGHPADGLVEVGRVDEAGWCTGRRRPPRGRRRPRRACPARAAAQTPSWPCRRRCRPAGRRPHRPPPARPRRSRHRRC